MGRLAFNSAKAAHDGNRDIVRFWAADGDKQILCAVSHEALTDYTGSTTANAAELVGLYQAHAGRIHSIAQQKYDRGVLESDGLILVRSADLT